MTKTEFKQKLDLLIVDLQEYRDENANITDFHIIMSLNEVKNAIFDGVLASPEKHAQYHAEIVENTPEQHTIYYEKR